MTVVSAFSPRAVSYTHLDVYKRQLEKRGIKVLAHSERNASQRRWVKDYFVREVQPLLVPVGLDPAHPFPQVANKTLTFNVRLSGRDAFGMSLIHI